MGEHLYIIFRLFDFLYLYVLFKKLRTLRHGMSHVSEANTKINKIKLLTRLPGQVI